MSRRMEWFYCISLNYISEVQHKKLKYFLGQNLVSFINSPQQTSWDSCLKLIEVLYGKINDKFSENLTKVRLKPRQNTYYVSDED